MSIIKLPLLFEGKEGEKHLYALFDSGANLSCIHPGCVGSLERASELPRSQILSTASGDKNIVVTHRVALDFYIEGVKLSDDFLLVPGLTEEAVIGAATMQKWRIKLDFEHDAVHVDPERCRWRV